MKRLLKIFFDLTLLSLIPVLSWFALGILVNKNLINVFSLTYPLQFIWYICKSIFSTGANISKEKDDNENAPMSGILIGSIIGFLVFGVIILNIDNYINFMNMDIAIYRDFAIYSVLQLYIQLVFNFFIEKLYFEDKNNLANKYSFGFGLLNFLVLVITSILSNKSIVIITITLTSMAIYTLFVAIKESNKFKLEFNLLKNIKYDSVELFNCISFFLIYLFGLSNVFEYGEAYATAITFAALITDTQWDAFTAVDIVAKIDICKGSLTYKELRNNSYKLLTILALSSVIMFLALFQSYSLNPYIITVFLTFEVISFALYPIYTIKTCFLQLEYSAMKTTVNKIISNICRFSFSFVKTPYCTGLGQVFSSLFQIVTINIMFSKNFKIECSGEIKKLSE